ncbi:MAG: LuxR C-terminal-related transcriptional regulator [Acidimicrobiales bacterium]
MTEVATLNQRPPHPASASWSGVLIGVADAAWAVQQISLDDHELLGHAPPLAVGTRLLDHVHAGDVADLRDAAIATRSGRSSSVLVNLGRPGDWHRTRIVVTPMVDDPAHVGFAVQPLGDGDPAERVLALEQHLWRIARELETAHVAFGGVEAAIDVEGVLSADSLSPRQWEVLRRLLQGERVPGIARALFLSNSTVRNHLTAIFAKFGVHSQEELIQLLRAQAGATPMSA